MGGSQHRTRQLEAARRDILKRRNANTGLEGAKELPDADLDQLSEVFSSDPLREVLLDIVDNAIHLPTHQAAARLQLMVSALGMAGARAQDGGRTQ